MGICGKTMTFVAQDKTKECVCCIKKEVAVPTNWSGSSCVLSVHHPGEQGGGEECSPPRPAGM